VKQLSSLLLTVYALGGVVLCLVTGILLAQLRPFSLVMPSMDHRLILDWLLAAFQGGATSLALGIWFLALCASVGLLVVNLCACTLTRLLPRLKNGTRLHSWLLLLAHVFMVLILLGHLSQMTLGFKEEGLKLLPGQSVELPGGLLLTVDQVQFRDDPGLLNLDYRQARKAHTTSAFHLERNLVGISLRQGDGPVVKGQLRLLEPFLNDGLRLTLSDFYRDDTGPTPRVGAVFTAVRNPLASLFFTAYLAWIVVYLLLAVRAFITTNGSSPMSRPAASSGASAETGA
jgi:hypothetical protein